MGYNSYDVCQEIIDNLNVRDWIGTCDIDDYLDRYYEDMSEDDRWFVHDRMEKFVDVDPYHSIEDSNVNDDWGEDEYEEDF